jgi:hypothetical protein
MSRLVDCLSQPSSLSNVNRARACGAIELVVSPAHTFADIAWRKSNGPRVHGYVRIFDWLVAAKRLPCPALSPSYYDYRPLAASSAS